MSMRVVGLGGWTRLLRAWRLLLLLRRARGVSAGARGRALARLVLCVWSLLLLGLLLLSGWGWRACRTSLPRHGFHGAYEDAARSVASTIWYRVFAIVAFVLALKTAIWCLGYRR